MVRQGACSSLPVRLNVVVQRELVGMRAQADRIGFVLSFVVDEGFEQFLGEHVALQQEGVILLDAR